MQREEAPLSGEAGFSAAQIALDVASAGQDIPQASLLFGHAIEPGQRIALSLEREKRAALRIGNAFDGDEPSSEIIAQETVGLHSACQIRHQARVIRVFDHALTKRFQIDQYQVARRSRGACTHGALLGQVHFDKATVAPALEFGIGQIQTLGLVPGVCCRSQHSFRQCRAGCGYGHKCSQHQHHCFAARQARHAADQRSRRHRHARQDRKQGQAQYPIVLPRHLDGFPFKMDEHVIGETGARELHQPEERQPHEHHRDQCQCRQQGRQRCRHQTRQESQQKKQCETAVKVRRLERGPTQIAQGPMHRQEQRCCNQHRKQQGAE